MKYDRSTFVLTHERSTGRWAVSVATSTRTVRIAGFLRYGPDSLQTAALLSGIAALEHLERRHKDAPKARIIVSSSYAPFLEKLDKDINTLVLPSRLRERLRKTLNTVSITVDAKTDAFQLSLSNWMRQTLVEFDAEFPASFVSEPA